MTFVTNISYPPQVFEQSLFLFMLRANKGRLFAKREEKSGGGINLEAPLLSLSGSLIRYTGKHSSVQSGNMRSPRQRLRPRLILLKIKIIASAAVWEDNASFSGAAPN